MCLYFPHHISKTDAAKITKLDLEIFRDESWEPRSKVKVTSHRKTLSAWVFALLWVSFSFSRVLVALHTCTDAFVLQYDRCRRCRACEWKTVRFTTAERERFTCSTWDNLLRNRTNFALMPTVNSVLSHRTEWVLGEIPQAVQSFSVIVIIIIMFVYEIADIPRN